MTRQETMTELHTTPNPNPKLSFFPCEVVALVQPAPVYDINKVSMIPCAEQRRIVLSQLCKAKVNNETKFCYAQFPFGLVDYKGLKQLQAHHESVHEKHITTEEMEWFKICRSTFSSHKPVYVSKLQALEAYFQDKVWTKTISEKGRQLRNLVGR